MKRYLLFVSVLVLVYHAGFSQDPHFSQFVNAPLYLNPALAGSDKYTSLYATQRSQWKGSASPYITNHFSLIVPVLHGTKGHDWNRGSVGVAAYTDVTGEAKQYKTTGANGSFTYNMHLSKNKAHNIHFALMGGVIIKNVNMDDFRWPSQFDRFIGFDPSRTKENLSDSKTLVDVGSGVYYTFTPRDKYVRQLKKFHVGYSAVHMTAPNESMGSTKSKMPVLHKFHPGLDWKLSTNLTVVNNLLVMMQRGEYEFNMASNLNYHFHKARGVVHDAYVGAGLGYRGSDSFILSTQFGSRYYRLSLSYDTDSQRLGAIGNTSTYEITFMAKFHKEHKKWKA